jgi:hypothetical protein
VKFNISIRYVFLQNSLKDFLYEEVRKALADRDARKKAVEDILKRKEEARMKEEEKERKMKEAEEERERQRQKEQEEQEERIQKNREKRKDKIQKARMMRNPLLANSTSEQETLSSAALKIQASFRGHLSRKESVILKQNWRQEEEKRVELARAEERKRAETIAQELDKAEEQGRKKVITSSSSSSLQAPVPRGRPRSPSWGDPDTKPVVKIDTEKLKIQQDLEGPKISSRTAPSLSGSLGPRTTTNPLSVMTGSLGSNSNSNWNHWSASLAAVGATTSEITSTTTSLSARKEKKDVKRMFEGLSLTVTPPSK